MRDKKYKAYSYKLDDEVAEEIKSLKYEEDISYNLLFKEFINNYKLTKKK